MEARGSLERDRPKVTLRNLKATATCPANHRRSPFPLQMWKGTAISKSRPARRNHRQSAFPLQTWKGTAISKSRPARRNHRQSAFPLQTWFPNHGSSPTCPANHRQSPFPSQTWKGTAISKSRPARRITSKARSHCRCGKEPRFRNRDLPGESPAKPVPVAGVERNRDLEIATCPANNSQSPFPLQTWFLNHGSSPTCPANHQRSPFPLQTWFPNHGSSRV
jgi:hypothetical protein